jgi:hypothetical protein
MATVANLGSDKMLIMAKPNQGSNEAFDAGKEIKAMKRLKPHCIASVAQLWLTADSCPWDWFATADSGIFATAGSDLWDWLSTEDSSLWEWLATSKSDLRDWLAAPDLT